MTALLAIFKANHDQLPLSNESLRSPTRGSIHTVHSPAMSSQYVTFSTLCMQYACMLILEEVAQ